MDALNNTRYSSDYQPGLTLNTESPRVISEPGHTLSTMYTELRSVEDSNLSKIPQQIRRFDHFFQQNLKHLSEKSLKCIDYDAIDYLNYYTQTSFAGVIADEQKGFFLSGGRSLTDSTFSDPKISNRLTMTNPLYIQDSNLATPGGIQESINGNLSNEGRVKKPTTKILELKAINKNFENKDNQIGIVDTSSHKRVISEPSEYPIINSNKGKFKSSAFSRSKEKKRSNGEEDPFSLQKRNIKVAEKEGRGPRKNTMPVLRKDVSPLNTGKGGFASSRNNVWTEPENDHQSLLNENENKIYKVKNDKNSEENKSVQIEEFSQRELTFSSKTKNTFKSADLTEIRRRDDLKYTFEVEEKETLNKKNQNNKIPILNFTQNSSKNGLIDLSPHGSQSARLVPIKKSVSSPKRSETHKISHREKSIKNLYINSSKQNHSSKNHNKQIADEKSASQKLSKKEQNNVESLVSITKRVQINTDAALSDQKDSGDRIQTLPDDLANPYKKTKRVVLRQTGILKKKIIIDPEKKEEVDTKTQDPLSKTLSKRTSENTVIVKDGEILPLNVMTGVEEGSSCWPSVIEADERTEVDEEELVFEKEDDKHEPKTKPFLYFDFKKKHKMKHGKIDNYFRFSTENYSSSDTAKAAQEKEFITEFNERIKTITNNVYGTACEKNGGIENLSKTYSIGNTKHSELGNTNPFEDFLKQDSTEVSTQKGHINESGHISRLDTVEIVEGNKSINRMNSNIGQEFQTETSIFPVKKENPTNWNKVTKTHSIRNWTITVNINPPIEEESQYMEDSIIPYITGNAGVSELVGEKKKDHALETEDIQGVEGNGSKNSFTRYKQYKFELNTRKPLEEVLEERTPLLEDLETENNQENDQSFRKVAENVFKFESFESDKLENFSLIKPIVRANLFGFIEKLMNHPVTNRFHEYLSIIPATTPSKKSYFCNNKHQFKYVPKIKENFYKFSEEIRIPYGVLFGALEEEKENITNKTCLAAFEDEKSEQSKGKGSGKIPIFELQAQSLICLRTIKFQFRPILVCLDSHVIQQIGNNSFSLQYLSFEFNKFRNNEFNYHTLGKMTKKMNDQNWAFLKKGFLNLYGKTLYGYFELKVELVDYEGSDVKEAESADKVDYYFTDLIIGRKV